MGPSPDDLEQAPEPQQPVSDEAEAMWTWARTAGVSREELLAALAASARRPEAPAAHRTPSRR